MESIQVKLGNLPFPYMSMYVYPYAGCWCCMKRSFLKLLKMDIAIEPFI